MSTSDLAGLNKKLILDPTTGIQDPLLNTLRAEDPDLVKLHPSPGRSRRCNSAAHCIAITVGNKPNGGTLWKKGPRAMCLSEMA